MPVITITPFGSTLGGPKERCDLKDDLEVGRFLPDGCEVTQAWRYSTADRVRYVWSKLPDSTHPLIAAMSVAFIDNKTLELSPDVVWTVVLQGVAQHIASHAPLRTAENDYNKRCAPVRLQLSSSPSSSWEAALFQDRHQLRGGSERHPELRKALDEVKFSTSSVSHRLVFDASLSSSDKYVVSSGEEGGCIELSYFCRGGGRIEHEGQIENAGGIPQVNVLGDARDWDTLARSAFAVLSEAGMESWKRKLVPTLAKIAASFQVEQSEDRSDAAFWANMFRLRPVSDFEDEDDEEYVSRVHGWATYLFPYSSTLRPIAHDDDDGIRPSDFPRGLARAQYAVTSPESVDNEVRDMHLVVGLLGVAQHEIKHMIRPELGWVIGRVTAYKRPIPTGLLGRMFVQDSSKIDEVTRAFLESAAADPSKATEYPQFLTALNSGLGATHGVPNNGISFDAFRDSKRRLTTDTDTH
jgi:hypothetical protein